MSWKFSPAKPVRCFMRFTRPVELLAALLLACAAPALADQHADDVKLGTQVYQDLQSKGQIVTNSPYNAILQSVGRRISAAAQPHWFTERFYVIRGNDMNAFAAPGGFVFVNEGLLRGVDNVEELANVLGHETAHLLLGHVEARNQQAQNRNLAYKIGHLFVNNSSQGSVNTYNAATTMGNYTFLGFTREQEYAADQKGAWLAARANFNPWGSVWFAQEVLRVQGDAGYEQYVQQHPSTKDRISHLEAYFKSNPQIFGRWHDHKPSTAGLPLS